MHFKKNNTGRLAFILPFFFILNAYGQSSQTNLPLNRAVTDTWEQALNKKDVQFHTAIKPYRQAAVDSFLSYDQAWPFDRLAGRNVVEKIWNAIAYESLIRVREPDFQLSIDPLFDFAVGQDLSADESVFTNTRGFSISGNIGDQFGFASTFRENQATFPTYLNDFIKQYSVVPGQGRVRKFKQNGVDYSNVTGYISFTPSRYVNFQFGQDNHFIGDGYRSMLLSDVPYAYPFLKIETTVWKLKYMNLWTQFQDLTHGTNFKGGFYRKWASFHYLSYATTPWLQIGLFEGVVWQGGDSTGSFRGLDISYLNPVIFYRPVEFGLGSPDNATLGLNIKLLPIDDLAFYGQFFMDDIDIARSRKGEGFYRNKFAWQAGVKWFHSSEPGQLTTLRFEYNQVKPYVYAHKIPEQNYAHYNQPLAGPLGANYREFLFIAGYRQKRLYTEAKLQLATYGSDTAGTHFGHDIFRSDYEIADFPNSYGNSTAQGLKNDLVTAELKAGYLINPVTQMRFEVSVFIRDLQNDVQNEHTSLVQFALKTGLFNRYYDF